MSKADRKLGANLDFLQLITCIRQVRHSRIEEYPHSKIAGCVFTQPRSNAARRSTSQNLCAEVLERHAGCPRVSAGFLPYRPGRGGLAAVMSQHFVVLGRLKHYCPLVRVGHMLGTLPQPRSTS
jgi:hypothetical protein